MPWVTFRMYNIYCDKKYISIVYNIISRFARLICLVRALNSKTTRRHRKTKLHVNALSGRNYRCTNLRSKVQIQVKRVEVLVVPCWLCSGRVRINGRKLCRHLTDIFADLLAWRCMTAWVCLNICVVLRTSFCVASRTSFLSWYRQSLILSRRRRSIIGFLIYNPN